MVTRDTKTSWNVVECSRNSHYAGKFIRKYTLGRSTDLPATANLCSKGGDKTALMGRKDMRDVNATAVAELHSETFRTCWILSITIFIWGTRWRSWLRHCATYQKGAGSIPDGVTGIFQWLNPSCRLVALGSTQPLTEMSTRHLSWG
jgi:hypothetical protein